MSHRVSPELRQLPVLAALPKRALAHAESLMTPVTFAAGAVLCREGHIGREAFLITAGTADITRNGEYAGSVDAGDLVGELALLGDGTRTATVTTTSPVTAYVMSSREFASLLELPGVADEVHRIAAGRHPRIPATV